MAFEKHSDIEKHFLVKSIFSFKVAAFSVMLMQILPILILRLYIHQYCILAQLNL